MAIPDNFVPYSCCDHHVHSEAACRNASQAVVGGKPAHRTDSADEHRDDLVIPKSFAYSTGCEHRIQFVLLPIFVSMSCVIIVCTSLCVIFGSIYLHYVEEEGVTVDKPIDFKLFSFIPGMQKD